VPFLSNLISERNDFRGAFEETAESIMMLDRDLVERLDAEYAGRISVAVAGGGAVVPSSGSE